MVHQEADAATFPDIVCGGGGLTYGGTGHVDLPTPPPRQDPPLTPPSDMPQGEQPGHCRNTVTPPRCVLDLDYEGLTGEGSGCRGTPRGRQRRRGSPDRSARAAMGSRAGQVTPPRGASVEGLLHVCALNTYGRGVCVPSFQFVEGRLHACALSAHGRGVCVPSF